MSNTLLRCKNVNMNYGNNTVVKDVSLEVNEGDYLCAVGENGSGKSTLLKGILGLMPLKSGSIEYLNGIKQNDIGYLPQQSAASNDFPASVYEIVLSGCLGQGNFIKPFYTKKEKQKANESISIMGIESIKKESFMELSGGQRQRVLLARALCSTQRLILLDEPITGLDPLAKKELYELIKKINIQKNVTIIMVSHDIGTAVKYANKILHLDAGVVFFGTSEDYVNSAAGKSFYRRETSD
ncbi:MAG TPA: ABC transporter ATP-binding protein [Clostridia bacterium]|nr:ABC transporter ATP-binding protein [Clostridia bacterium]